LRHLQYKDLETINNFPWDEQNLFVMRSIIEGKKNAETFVNDDQSSIMVWDKGHCIYLNGRVESSTDLESTIEFMLNQLLDSESRSRLGVAKMYFNESDQELLMNLLREFNPRILKRRLYRHNLDSPLQQVSLERNIAIKEIDLDALSGKNLTDYEPMIEEIVGMWGSIESFLGYGFGFGYYAINSDASIVNWCTSEYNSKLHCGIGIESIPGFQGKGIATATTTHFLTKCLEKGIIPYWDCWSSNIPSVKVAEKTGFEKILEYNVILIELN
jgi:RimJ/RimL family protein N-acetyltransferase